MTAHGCSVNYSQALPEVTVYDTVIVNLSFHLAEEQPLCGSAQMQEGTGPVGVGSHTQPAEQLV